MDLSFSDLNFNSVENLPGFEARAAFTVNSASVFREDVDIVPTVVDDSHSYIPWGGDNQMLCRGRRLDGLHFPTAWPSWCIYALPSCRELGAPLWRRCSGQTNARLRCREVWGIAGLWSKHKQEPHLLPRARSVCASPVRRRGATAACRGRFQTTSQTGCRAAVLWQAVRRFALSCI